MPTLTCTDRQGITRTFDYSFTHVPLDNQWTFRVTTIPPLPGGHFFELAVSEVRMNTVQVVMANHHNRPEYAGMGIPEALLPVVKNILRMDVESSPARGVGNIFRTQSATKYWERLVGTGGAIYDSVRDVYSVL